VAIDPQPEAAIPAGGHGPAFPPSVEGVSSERGPWYLAYKRFVRNRVAVAFLGLFVLIVVFVLAAPLWANNVAHTGPNDSHTLEKLHVNGEVREVVTPEGRPIGP
jgi:peptide/nickel transport system permease protein